MILKNRLSYNINTIFCSLGWRAITYSSHEAKLILQVKLWEEVGVELWAEVGVELWVGVGVELWEGIGCS